MAKTPEFWSKKYDRGSKAAPKVPTPSTTTQERTQPTATQQHTQWEKGEIAPRVTFYERQSAQRWKNMPFFWLRPFYAGAVDRLGEYVRVLKPGEYAVLDNHGIILEYRKRYLRFLGGFYFKWPFIETVMTVYIGTRQASRFTRSINSAGARETKLKAVYKELEKAVPITASQELSTAQGPQTQVLFFLMYEIHQVITALRLTIGSYDKPKIVRHQEDGEEVIEISDDFLDLAIMPNINSLMQDTLPDMLQGDIQRIPSELILLGTVNEIKAKVDGMYLRSEKAVTYWDSRRRENPFHKLDPNNLDSRSSREVIVELRKDEPFGDRERKRCLLVNIMDACGVRLRQFKKEEAEPEEAIRQKISEKGQAQMDVEIETIRARASYAKELIAQQERVASAQTDNQKVQIITNGILEGLTLPPVQLDRMRMRIRAYLAPFFQDRRTREVMAEKGRASTIFVGGGREDNLEQFLQNLFATEGLLGTGSAAGGMTDTDQASPSNKQ